MLNNDIKIVGAGLSAVRVGRQAYKDVESIQMGSEMGATGDKFGKPEDEDDTANVDEEDDGGTKGRIDFHFL